LQKSDDQVIGIQQLAVAEIVVTEGCVRLFNGITPDTVRSLWLALRDGIK
jgi:hypothetical protein